MSNKRIRLLAIGSFTLGVCSMLALISLPGSPFLRPIQINRAGEIAPQRSHTGAAKPKTPPCGKIEPIEMDFGNPDGIFPDQDERLREPRWVFENFSDAGLSRFLNSCPLRPDLKELLLDRK